MTTERGYDWDVYPRDLKSPRIALGRTDTMEAARTLVEAVLLVNESAGMGSVEHLFGERWLCRRTREPGTYAWIPWQGVDTADLAAGVA